MSKNPIGILDSDIGGLSVVSEFRKICLFEDIIYYADTKNYPYGTKKEEEVLSYFKNAVDFFLKHNVKTVFCACSTASAIAISKFQDKVNFKIFGMFDQNLIHYIRNKTMSNNIGLIATELTVDSKAFNKLFEKHYSEANLISVKARVLVDAVTNGDFTDKCMLPVIKELYNSFKNKQPLGSLIIGCTHFYHAISFIEKIFDSTYIVEPAKIAVRNLYNYLNAESLLNTKDHIGKTHCFVSKDVEVFKKRVEVLSEFTKINYFDEFYTA